LINEYNEYNLRISALQHPAFNTASTAMGAKVSDSWDTTCDKPWSFSMTAPKAVGNDAVDSTLENFIEKSYEIH
jgi:hypothetical protein